MQLLGQEQMPLKIKIHLLIYLIAFALTGIYSFRSHAYLYCEVRRQLTAFTLYHLPSSQQAWALIY